MQLGGKLYGGCNEKRNARGILSGAIKCEQRGEGNIPPLWSRKDGVEPVAMPQRDDPPSRCALRRTSTIEAIKRLEPPSRVRYGGPGALLEYAVMHGDEEEIERIREELRRVTDEV